MSNFYPNYYKTRQNTNNFRNRTNRSYESYENGSWNPSSCSVDAHYQITHNRSHEWFQQNWQRIQFDSYYSNQNRNNYGNHNRHRKNYWHRQRKIDEDSTLDGLPQEIQIAHMNKLKQYLEDDEEVYLDFKGLSIHESSYVCNLHNLSSVNNDYKGFELKNAVSSLHATLKCVESKLNLEVMCEECKDKKFRNVTYTKIFKKMDDKIKYGGETSDWDEEYEGNSKQENCDTDVKMIMKEDLYKFVSVDMEDDTDTCDTTNDWTLGLWKKSEEIISEENDEDGKIENEISNKRMAKLLKTYSTPVESDKAQRMMEKMGWAGGALGVNGEGIVDPIIPSVAFRQGAGLGHTNEPKKRIERKKPKYEAKIRKDDNWKSIFKTNVLQNILDFLCDDSSIEICFDCTLSKAERKAIHDIIECLRSEMDMDCDTMEQISLISRIYENMMYVLESESQGEGMNRKLHVYKAAPENVYLITPKDLIDELDEERYESPDKSLNMEVDKMAERNLPTENLESVPIDNSIDNNSASGDFKDKTKNVNSVSRSEFLKGLLTSYVKEFCEDEAMSELRFLGEFDRIDVAIINWFMADLTHKLQNCDKENRHCTEDLEVLYSNEHYDFNVYLKEREGSILYVLQKTKKTVDCTQAKSE